MKKKLLIACILALVLAGSAWGINSSVLFGGVGIDGVPRRDGTILVKQLVLGGPAQVAGIRQGDIITQIDGTPTKGRDFKFLVEHRLRGEAGTPVLLKVVRGDSKPQSYRLVRRELALASAKGH